MASQLMGMESSFREFQSFTADDMPTDLVSQAHVVFLNGLFNVVLSSVYDSF